MVVVETIRGDVLRSKPASGKWFIAQQCNCNTRKPHGLSDTIAKRWPYADPYGTRGGGPDTPGTIVVMEPPNPCRANDDAPTVLCLMAQWGPSKPGAYSHVYPRTYQDTYSNRKKWFAECLTVLDDLIPPDQTVNIPFQIGCGLAGGKWTEYLDMLESCQTRIRIWQLP